MLEQRVLELARHVAEGQGVEVVGVNMLGKGKGMLLRVTIDKNEGVTLDDCERFSRSLELMLDAEDALDTQYNLEVSSPGLNRPLTVMKDFERNIGKLARVITREKIYNQNFFIGRIFKVTEDSICLSTDKGEYCLPFDDISKARLEIEIK